MTTNGVASFQLKRDEERRAQQAAAEAAQQQAEQEARTQAEAQERARLEALRGERLVFEELQTLTDQEREHLAQVIDPDRQVKDLYRQAREQEEREALAQFEQEYQAELTAGRTPSLAQRSAARQQAEQRRQEKIRAWQAERDRRELQAENHPDEAIRLINSLGDRGKEIMRGMWQNRPQGMEAIRASRAAVAQQQTSNLLEQYKQEMLAVRGKPWKAHEVRAKYRSMGAPVDSVDFTGLM